MIWFALLIGGAIGMSWALLPFDMAFMITILGVILGGVSIYLGWRTEKLIRKMGEENNEIIKEWREERKIWKEEMKELIKEWWEERKMWKEETEKKSEEVKELIREWREERKIWKEEMEKKNEEVKELIKEWREGTDKRLAQTDKMIEEGKRETQKMIEEGRRETREILRWIEETLREIHKTQGDIARILEKMDEKAEHRHRELMGR
jgi:hypothetical protein